MTFRLYKFICKYLMKSSSREMIFGPLFSVLLWNLICRANNAVEVCETHLEWFDDSLGIYFAHMKNDVKGTRPGDARHIYANPYNPRNILVMIFFQNITSSAICRDETVRSLF